MKPWEKTLRAVQQLPEAIAEAAKWNAEWQGLGQRAAIARMEKSYFTNTRHFEVHTHATKKVVAEASSVGPVKVTTRVAVYDEKDDRVNKGQFVTKTRKVEFGRGAVMQINQYCRVLSKLEFTHEVVLTKAQRAYIEDVMLNPNKQYGQLRMSVRRKDTGATALYIREGNKHIVLFEDGSFTKTNHVPEFDGSWFFNKKVKREFKPVAEKAAGKFNASAKCFSLQSK